MLGGMPTMPSTDPRLDQARDLIRDKGLSRSRIYSSWTRSCGKGAASCSDRRGRRGTPARGSRPSGQAAPFVRLFLVFLNQLSGTPGETRAAMGLVLQHSLSSLGEAAAAAHREMLARNRGAGMDHQLWT